MRFEKDCLEIQIEIWKATLTALHIYIIHIYLRSFYSVSQFYLPHVPQFLLD